jgi:mxaK protein
MRTDAVWWTTLARRRLSMLGAQVLAQRTALFVIIAGIGLVGAGWSLLRLSDLAHQNAVLKAIAAGEDRDVAVGSWGGLAVARARFLDRRDRHDDAQTFIDAVLPGLDPGWQARVLYNHANVLIERAVARIERGDIDGSVALVNLAKQGYRRALQLEPDNFDIKYNYDVAMRLVRDFPPPGVDGEDETATPKKLWTDLPGIPKGLP